MFSFSENLCPYCVRPIFLLSIKLFKHGGFVITVVFGVLSM